MEPRIQYAKTKDGVSIAYWTMGEGMPFVVMSPALWDHIQMEWQHAGERSWLSRLIEKRTVIRYDNRGSGLSDRDVTDVSLDTLVTDLETVVDHRQLKRFALWAPLFSGPVAIAYATRHPERVSHLLLWCAFARTPAGTSRYWSRIDAMGSLIDEDWKLFTRTWAHVLLGWRAGEKALDLAAFMRESLTPTTCKAYLSVQASLDVSKLLPTVKCPTLVLHHRLFRFVGVAVARSLASQIPNAQLALLEGRSELPYEGDMEAVANAIDEFLSEGEEARPKEDLPEGMAVILFADIADSTLLTEQLGDAAFREKARELDTSLRTIIRECSGTPVEGKVLGDGVLAVFTSARQAIECALRCNAAGGSVGLQLHLGIHAGDVIREGNNVYGGAVNIAARIAGASAPGEVLVSDTVKSLGRTSADVIFDDRGQRRLKGVEGRQRLFAVRGDG
jgi:class 3 adenylate cyclase